MNETNSYVMAVATVSSTCGLDVKEFSGLLEIMQLLTAEQRSRIILFGQAWAVKDLIENREKAGKEVSA